MMGHFLNKERSNRVWHFFLSPIFSFSTLFLFSTGIAWANTDSTQNRQISVRLDCLHLFNRDKGASQECMTLSSLKVRLWDRQGENIESFIELDPMSGPDSLRNRLPGKLFYPERQGKLISEFGIFWQARPALMIKIGSHGGLDIPPKAHRGSFEGTLIGSGWSQLALSVNYKLSLFESFDVSMTVGNGEGELEKNLDPQQYFGFVAKAQVVKGVVAGIGLSLDGNSRGSEQSEWLEKHFSSSCGASFQANAGENIGFQTQRGVIYAGIDGTYPGMEGFTAMASMRRVTRRDLKEKAHAYPELSGNCRMEDWSWAFVEDRSLEKANSTVLALTSFSIGYRILDTFQLGLDFGTLSVQSSETEFLKTCGAILNGSCQEPNESVKKASQTAYSVFMGIGLNDRLELATEYHARTLDRLYDRFYYDDRNEKGSKETDLFNVRILYRFGV